MVTATETYRIYLLKNPMSRRSVISTLKSLNPPEGAAHQYKFLEEIPWYSNGDDIPPSSDKLLCRAYFLKASNNRVRLEGECIRIEY